jgi:hypothetical protein
MDVVATVKERWPQYLLVGRRTDLDMPDVVDTATPGWDADVLSRARLEGKPRSPLHIDCFVFSRDLYVDMPPFAVGRMCYDNWLVWRAGVRGAPVVDMTGYVPLVHQNHGYAHAGSMQMIWRGPEAERARQLLGHWSHYHSIDHARWTVDRNGDLARARDLAYRFARPRRWLSHQLRFTRSIRHRLRREPHLRAPSSEI